MAALISLSLWWIWLSVSVLRSAASESKRGTEITARFGQENITLTCRAPNNNNIMIVEWSRADLGDEYVLLYRNGHFDPDYQHLSFKNRVDLQDRQMKAGDASLILKNVTTDDKGTYECRVFERGTKRRKRANLNTDPISIISLSVVDPPGQAGGHTEDGGKEDGGKEAGSVGLIVGLSVVAVVFSAAVVLFLSCRTHLQCNQNSHHPPAEPQIKMSESFLNSESPAAEYNNRTELEANNCHEHSTRIPDVTLTLENELVCPPQETAGLLPERNIRVQ